MILSAGRSPPLTDCHTISLSLVTITAQTSVGPTVAEPHRHFTVPASFGIWITRCSSVLQTNNKAATAHLRVRSEKQHKVTFKILLLCLQNSEYIFLYLMESFICPMKFETELRLKQRTKGKKRHDANVWLFKPVPVLLTQQILKAHLLGSSPRHTMEKMKCHYPLKAYGTECQKIGARKEIKQREGIENGWSGISTWTGWSGKGERFSEHQNAAEHSYLK